MLPDETATASSEDDTKVSLPRIKNPKDWITALLGIGAAYTPYPVIKPLALAACPFVADYLLVGFKWLAAGYKARSKRNAPLIQARAYLKDINKRQRQVSRHSEAWNQFEQDKKEVNRFIHTTTMQSILYSVATPPTPTFISQQQPSNGITPTLLPPAQQAEE